MRSVKVLWSAVGLLLVAVVVLAVLLVRSEIRTPEAGTGEGEGPGKAPPGGHPNKVAVIGSRTITDEELRQRLVEKYGNELLNQLLDREAVRQEAEELQMTVSREEIDQELKRMQEGYESEEKFYDSMKKQLGITKAELREDVYYKLLLEKIAIRSVEVPEADIDAYIKQHPEEFKSYVQYHLYKIEVKTKEQAEKLVKDIRNGAEFSSMARKLSIDESTAAKGGDMGWVEENDPFFPPELLQAARSLNSGDVSKPIPLQSSYAVVQLKEKKEVIRVVDADTRAYIRKELALQRAVPLNELVKSLREKRHADILNPSLK